MHILDRTAVEDTHVVAYIAMIGSMLLGIGVDELLHLMDHLRTVTIEGKNIRQTSGKLIEDRDLTTTAFVHHRHTDTVTESGLTIHENRIHILDAGVATDVIVRDVVMDVIQVRIVAYLAVMQGRVIDTRMDLQPTRQFYLTTESTDLIMAGETGMMHVLRIKILRHLYVSPIGRRATLCLHLRNLLRCQ